MVPPQEKDEEGQWNQPEPYLDVLPHGEYTHGHEAIFIGDVKLSNFRHKLHDLGFRVSQIHLVHIHACMTLLV